MSYIINLKGESEATKFFGSHIAGETRRDVETRLRQVFPEAEVGRLMEKADIQRGVLADPHDTITMEDMRSAAKKMKDQALKPIGNRPPTMIKEIKANCRTCGTEVRVAIQVHGMKGMHDFLYPSEIPEFNRTERVSMQMHFRDKVRHKDPLSLEERIFTYQGEFIYQYYQLRWNGRVYDDYTNGTTYTEEEMNHVATNPGERGLRLIEILGADY